MMDNETLPPILVRRAGRVSAGIVLRIALALGAMSLAVYPSFGAELRLRGEVKASRDVLALSDLVEGASGAAAERPLFRAPALGETGTIQARRIVEAAAELGFGPVDAAGRAQVSVTRPARKVTAAEVEAALRGALERQHGLDPRHLTVTLDAAPALLVPAEAGADAAVEDLAYDRRARRVAALLVLGERRATARVTGTLQETVEVAVAARPLARGDAVGAGDVVLERRPRETVPSDVADGASARGQVARRALSQGAILRTGDLAKPEIVARGEIVTVVYEAPGLLLTLRGKANEAGALGETVTVTNPASKKILQATVVAPGKVSVSAAIPGRLALQ